MTSKLTREQLHERARENVKALKLASRQTAFESARKEILADLQLAEIALAAMDSEPVAYMTYKGYLLHAGDPKLAEYSEPTPLYADSRPAAMPAAPVAWLWSRNGDDERDVSLTPPDDDDDAADAIECGWTATPLYRHAQQPVVLDDGRADFEAWMLMRWGRERRDDDFAMGKFIYGEDYADSYTRCVWKAWSASRAAMLNGGKP